MHYQLIHKMKIRFFCKDAADTNDIIKSLYIGLLRRLPDQGGIKRYSKIIKEGKLKDVAKEIVDSYEFNRAYLETDDPYDLIHPVDVLNKSIDIFVHIPKAAGSSLYTMISQTFGSDYCTPPFWRLSSKPFSWLYKYSMWFGHFDYDEVNLISIHDKKRFFTFLRNPEERLISLYTFWKSHDPSYFFQDKSILFANNLDIVAFLNNKWTNDHIYWNEMTKFIVGIRIWREWKNAYSSLKTELEIERFIKDEVRQKVKDRLKEFSFVGIQENFERSARVFFHILGKDCPEIGQANITDKNMELSGFKKVKKPQITPELKEALKDLTRLDWIVYEEGKKIHFELLRKYSQISELPFVIDFKSGGNSDRFIVKGFSKAEHWGTWSQSNEVTISFCLDENVKPRYIKLCFNIFANEQHAKVFEFYLNNHLLGIKTYNKDCDEITFDISNFIGHENTLVIKIPNAVSPKSLGINEDTRMLGIGLKQIDIY